MKQILRSSFVALFFLGTALYGTAQTQSWVSDPVHSGVSYIVRHVMTPMMGHFTSFNVAIIWDEENLEACSVEATLDPKSVVMGNDGLAKHLQGEDFFNSAKYDSWSFKSREIQEDDGKYVAVGELSICGETKEIAIPFEYLGSMELGRGTKAGFLAEFAIDRTQFGVMYDEEGELVGKRVSIRVALEMNLMKK